MAMVELRDMPNLAGLGKLQDLRQIFIVDLVTNFTYGNTFKSFPVNTANC